MGERDLTSKRRRPRWRKSSVFDSEGSLVRVSNAPSEGLKGACSKVLTLKRVFLVMRMVEPLEKRRVAEDSGPVVMTADSERSSSFLSW